MLNELSVRNLGVVDHLQITFDAGMTAVTGETGAGKTLIIDAIGLLLGQRADPALVKQGADEAVVEGRFSDGDDELILTRVVPVTGRSRAYLDGNLATASMLSEVSTRQVDLYAQHAHQSLTTTAGQRNALDRFGEIDLSALDAATRQVRELEAELDRIGGDAATREREIEVLRHQLTELDDANVIDPDEDENLAAEQALLGNVVENRERGEKSLKLLGDDGGAADLLARGVAVLGSDEVYLAETKRLSGLAEEVVDAVRELRRRVEALAEDPERLEAVNERRKLLASLRRRHGDGTLAGLMDAHRDLAIRLDELTHAGERGKALADQLDRARSAVADEAAVVGRERREAARRMSVAVKRELRDLALPTARFEVEVPEEDPADAVQMRFTANPGTRIAPLAKVASGGELARVMLAVRLVASSDRDTLVFDEVDAGIGGSAAVTVGAALARLAEQRQVVVVTHLAQVASAAGRQIAVEKSAEKHSTRVEVRVLADDERVVELSRMLSGTPSSDAARAHARELLESAGGGDRHD